MNAARRPTSATLVSLCCVLAGCLLWSVPALAFKTRVNSSSFGSSGAGAGQVSSPAGLAVDSTTHDVYVADTGNRRIDEFEADGTFVRAWGWGVGDGVSAEFQTCTIVCFAGLSGSGPGEFESPTFVAVDNSAGASKGDVYVGDTGDGIVTKFSESGALIESWGTNGQLNGSSTGAGSFGALAGVAVGSTGTGTLYVINTASKVSEFEQGGVFATEFEVVRETRPHGLAVDSGGYLFKVNADLSVEEITGANAYVGQVTPGPGQQSGRMTSGLASAGTELYVAEPGGARVYAFTEPGVVSEPDGSPCNVGSGFTCEATESFGFGTLGAGSGIAGDPSSGDIYVADASADDVDVFTGVVLPDVTSEPVSSLDAKTATLNGTVNPDGAGEATCRFVWGTTAAFGNVAPCSEPVAEGESPVAVHAVLSGLRPDTTYHYRLQASNANGTDPGEASQDREFTTPGPAVLSSESVSNVASTSATLEAGIELHSAPATYYFQYGTSTGYGSYAPAAPGATLGSGAGEVEVSQHVQGISAGTVYHYRAVTVTQFEVSSGVFETAETNGPDQTFTTQRAGSALALPDGREWEMVSPPNKFGAALKSITPGVTGLYPIQASAAGDAITYVASAPIEAQPPGNTFAPQVLSLRGSAGWESRDIAIPHTETAPLAEPLEYLSFSEDLSHAVVDPYRGLDLSLSKEASEQTAFVRTDYLNGDVNDPCVESCYRPVVTGAPGFADVPVGTKFGGCEGAVCGPSNTECPPAFRCGPQFQGASPDLSHIVVSSSVGLTEGTGGGLYEWSGGQKLTFVGTGVVGGEQGFTQEAASSHAVSDDGSRVIIKGNSEGQGGLLVRDTAKGETVKLGEPGESSAGASLQATSPDLSRIVFNTGPEFGDALEECEIVELAGHLHCDRSNLAPGAAVFAPIVGASEDASYVYFATNSVLTGEEKNGRGEEALPGDCARQSRSAAETCNLYVNHDGVNKFISVLSDADELDWGRQYDAYEQGFFATALQESSARVSSNGRRLAFMSQRPLTGYDNRDASSGQPDEEVYLYDAAAAGGEGSITCASCDPTGARPHGVEANSLTEGPLSGLNTTWEGEWLAAVVPGWTTMLYQSRYLSDSGRLFFDSPDALVPQDTNNAMDVYEYEPPSIGDCSESSVTFSQRSGGCIGLISSGASPEQSAFLDASENGNDVFFLTAGKLSSQDVDTALDVYDAHVCSGAAPCPPPPPPPPPACVGDACQSPTGAPEDATPGSLTFSGPGNLAPLAAAKTTPRKTTHCVKGKKLEHGKCVKGKAKKQKRKAKRSRAIKAGDKRRARS